MRKGHRELGMSQKSQQVVEFNMLRPGKMVTMSAGSIFFQPGIPPEKNDWGSDALGSKDFERTPKSMQIDGLCAPHFIFHRLSLFYRLLFPILSHSKLGNAKLVIISVLRMQKNPYFTIKRSQK